MPLMHVYFSKLYGDKIVWEFANKGKRMFYDGRNCKRDEHCQSKRVMEVAKQSNFFDGKSLDMENLI